LSLRASRFVALVLAEYARHRRAHRDRECS
jgi:hypothetical protein